jgi:UDP-GlcNAc:undecaprenyl-phosphate GlcNAc-1-phosphate transferase
MIRLAIPAMAAFVLTLLLTPACRAASKRFGCVDYPGVRKLHQTPIPRAGGIAIFLSYAAAVCTHSWIILPAVFVAFATGLLDDLVSLRPKTKIAGQAVAALLFCAAAIPIRNVAWWQIPLTVLWLVGCTNAVNLIDGLDGLAAGVGFLAAGAAFTVALLTGNAPLAILAAPLLGSLLGFLPYNSYPASIFMGDCGSHTIGFLLGCFTVLWAQHNPALPQMAAPLIALTIPILDTGLAIFRRFIRRQPILEADRGHIHHRLLCRGIDPRSTARILHAAGALFATLSVLLAAGAFCSGAILAGFAIVIWAAFRYLRYDEFATLRRVFLGGVLGHAIRCDLAVQQFERAVESAVSLDDCWLALEDCARALGLSRATLRIYGRTYSEQFGIAGRCWSLAIPLHNAGSVDIEAPFGAPSVTPLADSLGKVLAPKLHSLRPQLTLAAAAGRR